MQKGRQLTYAQQRSAYFQLRLGRGLLVAVVAGVGDPYRLDQRRFLDGKDSELSLAPSHAPGICQTAADTSVG